MKVYLSGPMSGIKDMNAPAFVEAAALLRELGHHVFSPVEADIADGIQLEGRTAPDEKTWGQLLGRDVTALADGDFDAIVLLNGWYSSRGSKLEACEAVLLGLNVFELHFRGAGASPSMTKIGSDLVLDVIRITTVGRTK
jgi:hypothetical protein